MTTAQAQGTGQIELPRFLDDPCKRHLIGGEWVDSADGKTFKTLNPSTGVGLADIAEGGVEDVDRAVAAARAAFEGPWARYTPAQRQDVLLGLASLVESRYRELRLLDVLEMGQPIGEDLSLGVEPVVNLLRYYAGLATHIHGETIHPSVGDIEFGYTLREPVGVVGAIVPWNAPLITALWKIAPALATGCTTILKPSEEASLSPLLLGEMVESLDLPPGVLNIVTGGGTVGAALAEHRDIDKITFTGSTVTGQRIVAAAAGNLKRLSLELGGKSPDVVFADAPPEATVGAAMAVFANSGQVCCAGTRVFVERSIYEEFVTGMAEVADGLRVGNSVEPSTEIGPIVSEKQLARVTSYLEAGRAEGARSVAGGERVTEGELGNGYFVRPTVFADVSDTMTIAREEIFGPVASVMPFDTIDEVVQRANDTPFGLGGGVWTRDLGKAHHLARSLRTGVVWINTYNQQDAAMPFGGYKMSGWGRELSMYSLEEYLNVKAVWVNA
jgi:aldehyde dehydrogenase (NAD+)